MLGGITGKGWRPGESGNPGGRRKFPQFRESCGKVKAVTERGSYPPIVDSGGKHK